MILEELARLHPDGRRDYIYYLAFGNARIKSYSEGLKYCRAFLEIESNDQVRSLEVSLMTSLIQQIYMEHVPRSFRNTLRNRVTKRLPKGWLSLAELPSCWAEFWGLESPWPESK